jgi:hypothetical protein
MKVRITTGRGWHVDNVGEEFEVYFSEGVFYLEEERNQYGQRFIGPGYCEIVEEPKTLRDEFAMAALGGLFSNNRIEIVNYDQCSKECYKMADAMMEARK